MDISKITFDFTSFSSYEALIAIAIGIFVCLFGYKLKKVAFAIIWFVIGYYLASLAVPHITSDANLQIVLPIAAGAILSVIGFSLERLCIFGIAAFAVATTIIDLFQLTDTLWIALAIGAGVVAGCIAVAFIKPLGILTTALSGAKLIAKYSVIQLSLSHNPYFFWILLVAAVAGSLFQFKNCKHIV